MKRFALSMMILLAVAGFAAAQTTGGKTADPQPPAQSVVKIEGKLALINGEVGIQIKDKTYYLSMPQNLFGFIDGLKEGAQVKLEGYEYSNSKTPAYVQFRVTKLTFNGKDYDFSQYQGRGMMGGAGQGRMMDGQGFGPGNADDGTGRQQGRGRGNRS